MEALCHKRRDRSNPKLAKTLINSGLVAALIPVFGALVDDAPGRDCEYNGDDAREVPLVDLKRPLHVQSPPLGIGFLIGGRLDDFDDVQGW